MGTPQGGIGWIVDAEWEIEHSVDDSRVDVTDWVRTRASIVLFLESTIAALTNSSISSMRGARWVLSQSSATNSETPIALMNSASVGLVLAYSRHSRIGRID